MLAFRLERTFEISWQETTQPWEDKKSK